MNNEQLISAIENCKSVTYAFNGEKCIAEPCALGIGHDGAMALTAYQTSGPTLIPDFPWVYRRIDEFEDLLATGLTFEPRYHHCAKDLRLQKVLAAVGVRK